MRIAYLSTYPPTPCGVAEYTRSLVEALKTLANSVEIVILSDKVGGLEERVDDLGVKVIPCFTPKKAEYEDLLAAVREHGPFDLIHIQHEFNLFPPLNCTFEAFKKLKKHCRVLLATFHTIVNSARKRRAKHQRRLCKLLDAVIVHSILQEFELWNQGVDMAKVWRIPHGTSISELSKLSKEEALEKLGIPELKDKFIFASIGFLRRDKGQEVLIRAFKKLRQKYPNVTLLLAGMPQGADGARCASTINGMLSNDGIIVLRRYLTRDETVLAVRAADVLVFAYKEPPWKVSVSGAFRLALGGFKPVICSRVPRLVECSILVPEATFPPNNVEALAAKMAAAVTNYEEFQEVCKPLMRLAEETSWDRIAQIHLNLYKCLLGEYHSVKPLAG